MALTGVLRPGHIAIRVLEMAPALKHYSEVLGLIETARDDKTKRVFLKAWDEHDHHSVVLREADEAGMDYLGWRVDSPATLKKLAADIEKSGLAYETEWIPAGEHPMTGEYSTKTRDLLQRLTAPAPVAPAGPPPMTTKS